MRSVLRNKPVSSRSCYSCSLDLQGAFAACRFCRSPYHVECSAAEGRCLRRTCEGRAVSEAFDLVNRSITVVPGPEPAKPWWVRQKEIVVRAGIALGLAGVQGLNSLIPISPWVGLALFAVLVFGGIAFTALTPSADD
mgnify:FL=1